MVTLSAKAKLFLEAVLSDSRADWLKGEVQSLGLDPWSRPLTERATRIALDAFRETEKHLRDRLGDPRIDDDEEADLVNDLGFVDAVQSDLRRSLRGD